MKFNRESVLNALDAGCTTAEVRGLDYLVTVCAAGTDCAAAKHPDSRVLRLEYADIIDLRAGVAS